MLITVLTVWTVQVKNSIDVAAGATTVPRETAAAMMRPGVHHIRYRMEEKISLCV